MSDSPKTEKLRRVLDDHASDLEETATETADSETADVCRLLAALARGEHPPNGVARRVIERARDGDE